MKDPKQQAIQVAIQFCKDCLFSGCLKDVILHDTPQVRKYHIDNWTRIRPDELPAKVRCPDFAHVAMGVRKRAARRKKADLKRKAVRWQKV